MEAAIPSVIPSSFGFISPTNSRSRSTSTVFNVKGHLNLKCQSVPGDRRRGFGWKKRTIVKALQSASDSGSDTSGSATRIGPLRLESPIGQFLSEILVSHPDLVRTAVEWQLKQLQKDRDAEEHKKESSASVFESSLYRRIAEEKAKERKKAVEEILYVLVVQKFMEANVSMIPRVSSPSPDSDSDSDSDSSGRVDNWASLGRELEKLHSPEAYKMIQEHLALISGNLFGDSTKVTRMSKLKIRRAYGGWVVYGYFVKWLDVRFQLEKRIEILPYDSDVEGAMGGKMPSSPPPGGSTSSDDSVQSVEESQPTEVSFRAGGGSTPGSSGRRKKWKKVSSLGSYVMSIDSETQMRYTTVRSEEAVRIVQKHIQALLGPQESKECSEDEVIKISMGWLKETCFGGCHFWFSSLGC